MATGGRDATGESTIRDSSKRKLTVIKICWLEVSQEPELYFRGESTSSMLNHSAYHSPYGFKFYVEREQHLIITYVYLPIYFNLFITVHTLFTVYIKEMVIIPST